MASVKHIHFIMQPFRTTELDRTRTSRTEPGPTERTRISRTEPGLSAASEGGLGRSGTPLGASWGGSWRVLKGHCFGASWGRLGSSRGVLKASWVRLEAVSWGCAAVRIRLKYHICMPKSPPLLEPTPRENRHLRLQLENLHA